jgi:hypothetical protein
MYYSLRPWDTMNDVIQYERDFVIQTKTRHQTPIVHTTSISAPGGGASDDKVSAASRGHSRQPSRDHVLAVAARTKRLSVKRLHSSLHGVHGGSTAARNSTPVGAVMASNLCDSESSLSAGLSESSCSVMNAPLHLITFDVRHPQARMIC